MWKLPDLLPKKEKKTPKLWQVITLSPWLVALFLLGVYLLTESITLYQNGIHTQAEVSEVYTSGGDEVEYYPTFIFSDEHGQSYENTPAFSSSLPYKVGEIIEIIYLPEDPAGTATINQPVELWFVPIIIVLVAIIAECSLLFSLFQQKKGHHQPNIKNQADSLQGDPVISRYWQTVPLGNEKRLQVQYQYRDQTYTILSQKFTEKELKKLIPGQEITLLVDPDIPSQALVII